MEREEAQRRALRMGANAVLVVNPDEVNAEPRIHEALSGTSWRTEQHYLALYVGPPPTVDSTDS